MIYPLITSLINQEAYWDFVDENNIKLNLKKDMDKIKKSKLYETFNKLFSDIKNEKYKFNLIELIYPDKFQEIILGKKYTNTLKPILYIDIFDIIFMYKCNFNCDKLIEYFYGKLI